VIESALVSLAEDLKLGQRSGQTAGGFRRKNVIRKMVDGSSLLHLAATIGYSK